MRPIALALILALAPALAWGAEPRAVITGPSTATVGERLLYDLTGSASDTPLRVKIKGPVQPAYQLWYDVKQQPGLLVVTPTRAGTYSFVVVASGKPDGATETAYDFDAISVVVTATPDPEPEPPPPVDPVVPDPTPPVPVGDYDPAFVAVGKALAVQFAADYAAAMLDGAKLLDAGQARTPAYDTIAKAFSANRQASFERIAAPALDRVSPGATPDAKLTPEQNKALARAIRGLAKGASGR